MLNLTQVVKGSADSLHEWSRLRAWDKLFAAYDKEKIILLGDGDDDDHDVHKSISHGHIQ